MTIVIYKKENGRKTTCAPPLHNYLCIKNFFSFFNFCFLKYIVMGSLRVVKPEFGYHYP